jgi:DNA-binding NarL/FixJ family response regulator
LLDRHPLWLDAVESVIERIGVRVVGKTTDPIHAIDLVVELEPDVFVAEPLTGDPNIGGVGWLQTALARASSDLKLIVLAASADPNDVDAAFDAGAEAYVFKTAHPDDVAAAIRQAFDQSVFLANGYRRPAEVQKPLPTAAGDWLGRDEQSGAPALTKRELEILQLVAEGHSNGELARLLWVTEQTIKFHLSNIYRKLDVSNRTEASRWAQRSGLLNVETAA